jgi:hypothetical protein
MFITMGKHDSRLPLASLLLLILVWPAGARAQSSVPQDAIEPLLDL